MARTLVPPSSATEKERAPRAVDGRVAAPGLGAAPSVSFRLTHPGLIGADLYLQGVALVPTANPLGAVFSNGQHLVIGG
ncbi:MAG: hypothetical protein AAF628_01645 [Planctomycetota bacterium]